MVLPEVHGLCVSKKYPVAYGQASMEENIKTITGIISWLLKKGLQEYRELEPQNKKTEGSLEDTGHHEYMFNPPTYSSYLYISFIINQDN